MAKDSSDVNGGRGDAPSQDSTPVSQFPVRHENFPALSVSQCVRRKKLPYQLLSTLVMRISSGGTSKRIRSMDGAESIHTEYLHPFSTMNCFDVEPSQIHCSK